MKDLISAHRHKLWKIGIN